MPVSNLFGDIPSNRSQETFEAILDAPGIRIERIVSHGQSSPVGFWYDQPQREWVVVVAGSAVFQLENEPPIELHPGDWVDIPPHRRHRVEATDPDAPTIWLAVHFGASINTNLAP